MHCVQAKKEQLQADRNLRSMLNHSTQLFLIRTLLISFFSSLPLKKKIMFPQSRLLRRRTLGAYYEYSDWK